MLVKRILSNIMWFFLGAGFMNLAAQCEPDTIGCEDILIPGQICPDTLPDAYLGIPYSEVVTILPPYGTTINNIFVPLVKIELVGVRGFPPGIGFEPSATMMFVDTAYCVLLEGTPTNTGIYKLEIEVIPYIQLVINQDTTALASIPVTDTTLYIEVFEATGIEPEDYSDKWFMNPYPNPFENKTSFTYHLPQPSDMVLSVFNMVGENLYTERLEDVMGEGRFGFNGASLPRGIYIVSIRSGNRKENYRLVKTR